MRKPILAYIPALARHQGVNAAHPISLQLPIRRESEATRINKDGLVEQVPTDLPRQDWEGGNCPSLLLEPQRTNLLKYSEDYSQSEWSKIRTTISINQSIAPDGTYTANKIIPTVDNNTHRCDQVITLTNGTSYTLSFFAKANGYNCIRASIGQSGLTFGNVASFNLDAETVSTTGTIENAEILDFGNGWFRCIVTMQASTTDRVVVGLGENNSYSFEGDNSSGLFMWGAQLEQGSYASTYIKTESSTVTREKDSAIGWGGSWLTGADLSEGSWFLDLTPFKNSSAQREIYIHDGTNNNRIVIQFQSNNTQVRYLVASGGSVVVSSYEPITINTRSKILVTFKQDDFKIYINGSLEGTDAIGSVPTGLNQFSFANISGQFNFEGKVHDTRIYDYVLSEEEIIKLTS